jgi:hypothetical protein
MICGFAEETVGYIPTDEAFAEGGYETSFGAWSVLSPSSEGIVRQQAIALVHATHPQCETQKASSEDDPASIGRP